MSTFEALATSVLNGLEKKLDEVKTAVPTDDRIRTLAREALTSEWQAWKRLAYAFIAGLMLFSGIGVWQFEFLFQAIFEKMPLVKLFQSQPFKSELAGLGLDQLPKVKTGLPPEVWGTIRNAKKEEFDELFGHPGFYRALFDRFRNDFSLEFGTPDKPTQVRSDAVEKYGAVELKAMAKMVAQRYDGQDAICPGRILDHDKLQIVVVIPRNADPLSYAWFGCSANYPQTTSIKVQAEGKKIDGVVLVGVERRDVRDLEVKLTRRAALGLELNGAKDYKARGPVTISVSDATD